MTKELIAAAGEESQPPPPPGSPPPPPGSPPPPPPPAEASEQTVSKPPSGVPKSIHVAAREGDLEALIQAIGSGDDVDVDSRDKLKRTALHMASWAGQVRVAWHMLCMTAWS